MARARLRIAVSLGGLDPMRRIIAALPMPYCASVFLVMHIGNNSSHAPFLLNRPGFPAVFAQDGTAIKPPDVYLRRLIIT